MTQLINQPVQQRCTNFSYLLGFLLELLDGPLVDAATLVDEMAGGGGLAGIDVADDHDVDMSLVLAHCEFENDLDSCETDFVSIPKNTQLNSNAGFLPQRDTSERGGSRVCCQLAMTSC